MHHNAATGEQAEVWQGEQGDGETTIRKYLRLSKEVGGK